MNRTTMTHDDAELLMPWYANNSLGNEERRLVGNHLETCAECRASLELLLQMRTAVNDPRAIPLVPEPNPDGLLDRIDGADRRAASARQYGRWLVAAGIAVVAVVAALLLTRAPITVPDPAFSTVTSQSTAGEFGFVLDLTLAAEVSEEQRADLLRDIGARVLSEADSALVRVVIPMNASSMTELEAFRSALTDRPEISAADVVAIQLPVQKTER